MTDNSKRQTGTDTIGNGQRALWTFLFYTLVGPFFAALAVAVLVATGLPLGFTIPADSPSLALPIAAAFIWSAIPAAIAGLALVPFVLRRGTFGWIEAAVAGVAAFALAVVISPFTSGDALPYLAFLAGLISIAVRAVLKAARILA